MPRITLLLFSLIITLAAFAFQNTTTQAAPPTPNQLAWESYGPYGGAISLIEVADGDPMILYAVDDFSGEYRHRGLFRSEDGGVSWAFIKEFENIINNVIIDPADTSILYVALGDGITYKSINGGIAWYRIKFPDGTAPYDIIIDRLSHNRAYGRGWEGRLFKTVDGGMSWELIEGYIDAFAVDPFDSNILYATDETGELKKSTNGGVSWINVTNDLQNVVIETLFTDPYRPGTFYIAASRYYLSPVIYKSVDGGVHWLEVPLLFYNDATIVDVIPRPGEPESFYVVETYSNYLRIGLLVESSISSRAVEPAPTYLINDFAVSPDDTNKIYFASERGFGLSPDAGETWNFSNQGLALATVLTLVADPEIPNTLFAGLLYGGIVKSIDGGRTWRNLYISDEFGDYAVAHLAIAPSDPITIYAFTYGLGVYRSRSSGETWERVGSVFSNNVAIYSVAVHPFDHLTVYAGLGQGLYRTVNGGNTWNPIDPQATFELAISSQTPPLLHRIANAPTAPFKEWQWSEESNFSWQSGSTDGIICREIPDEPSPYLYCTEVMELAVAPSLPSTLYSTIFDAHPDQAGDGNGIYKSADSGQTWTRIYSGFPNVPPRWQFGVTDIEVDPSDPNLVYIAYNLNVYISYNFYQGHLIYSTDGGITWRDRSAGLGRTAINAIASDHFDPTKLYLAGIGVYAPTTWYGTYLPLLQRHFVN